jgi:hypothetical protein
LNDVVKVRGLLRERHRLVAENADAARGEDDDLAPGVNGDIAHFVVGEPAAAVAEGPVRAVVAGKADGRTDPHGAIGTERERANVYTGQALGWREALHALALVIDRDAAEATGPDAPLRVLRHGVHI